MQDTLVKIISNVDTSIVDSTIVNTIATGEVNTIWYGIGIVVFIITLSGILVWRDGVNSNKRKANK